MTDYFLYSGDIAYEDYPKFIELVEGAQSNADVALVLSTFGGNAEAAYKIGRCLQSRYENVKIFVPGMCKSAGTILAIAANELIFSPSGELGPLDVQMAKKDSIAERESGLDMNETFKYLESRSREMFHELVEEITQKSDGAISFRTASSFAARIASSLFNPIFANINPDDIGKRARAMQIAGDYGRRLNLRSENLGDAHYAIGFLTWGCPSHGFVIDMEEAGMLFRNVRGTDEVEENLVRQFRNPNEETTMKVITNQFQKNEFKEVESIRGNPKKLKDSQTTTNERNEESRDKT